MRLILCLFLTLGFSWMRADNNRFFWDNWSTHQPVLYAVAIATKGPIIEFGCGNGSTDLLHEICEKEGRILITLDDDLKWLTQFSKKYQGHGYNPDNSGWHKFYYVPGKNLADQASPAHWIKFMDEFELMNELSFDLCFIDQAPWLARYETVKRMKDRARFVIIHDADYFPINGIFGKVIHPSFNNNEVQFDFSDLFSSFQMYFPHQPGPPTLLGSNFEETFPVVDYSSKIVIKK